MARLGLPPNMQEFFVYGVRDEGVRASFSPKVWESVPEEIIDKSRFYLHYRAHPTALRRGGFTEKDLGEAKGLVDQYFQEHGKPFTFSELLDQLTKVQEHLDSCSDPEGEAKKIGLECFREQPAGGKETSPLDWEKFYELTDFRPENK